MPQIETIFQRYGDLALVVRTHEDGHITAAPAEEFPADMEGCLDAIPDDDLSDRWACLVCHAAVCCPEYDGDDYEGLCVICGEAQKQKDAALHEAMNRGLRTRTPQWYAERAEARGEI